MAEMLLINPRRRKARKSTAKRKTRRNPVRARAPRRPARRRANPINNLRSRVMKRRKNPVRRMKRRQNPISLRGTASAFMSQVKDAFIGAAGAIGVDMLLARLNPMLPPTLQRVPGKVGVGDAIAALATVLLGRVLDKPTRGLAKKAATGALTVQAHRIAVSMLPAGMVINGLGYANPAAVIPGTARVGPIRSGITPGGGMARYAGPTPALLNAYMRPGASALLNGRQSAREREGVGIR